MYTIIRKHATYIYAFILYYIYYIFEKNKHYQ